MEVIKLSRQSINKVAEILNKDGAIVFPTDTVYGFICNAQNKKAINKIFKIKNRPKIKPLAVFVKDIKMAKTLAGISPEQEKILKKYWPGKYTFIFESKIKNNLITKNNKIAIRIPNYKFLKILLKKINRPLAQTSVNISGQKELNKISEIIFIFEKLKTKPELIIDAGNLSKRKSSTIIDLTGKEFKILRK